MTKKDYAEVLKSILQLQIDEVNDDIKKGIVEVYECQGCGYTENFYYTFDYAEGRMADRTLIYSDRRKP